jgi:Tfp pilus assembly protein PilZ
MTILKASVGTSAQFFERYLADLPGGGLFIPMKRPLAIGTPVVVLVRAGVRAVPILLRGSVVLIRSGKHKPRTKAGIGVEFLASEKNRRNYLLARARGEIAGTAGRRHQRLPIDLPIRWSLAGSPEDRPGVLRDIGRGGAFVESYQPTTGQEVVLKVIPPGAVAETPIMARIAWVAPGPATGFGVSWNARGPVGSRRIKELIRRMEELDHGETS